MMKYIAYCRKSTDEPDRQILSIEAQVEELKEFAERESLQIVDFVVESKTAKEPGREKFGSVLQRIESGEAGGILSWHPDRLARNSIDGGKIIYLVDTGKIVDLKFPSFWFENTPQGKFMLSIAFGQSKYYVDNLSENIKRGNRQKLRRGEFPGRAPFGYLNDPISRTMVIDHKRAKFVKTAFEMLASGKFATVDLRNYFRENNVIDKWGYKVTHFTRIKRILMDPFYYGTFRFVGELYEGKHKPLISKKLFDKVQEILKSRNRNHKDGKYNFDFLGLMKCGQCGCSITAEKHIKFYKRKGRTAEYIYYRCSKKKGPCNQKFSPGEEIEQQIRKSLQKVSLPDFAAKKFLGWADEDVKNEKTLSAGQVEILKVQLKEAEEKLDRLLEGYLDKIVDPLDYQKKKNSLLEAKQNVQAQIEEINKNGSSWLEPFQEFVDKASEIGKIARAKKNGKDLRIFAQMVGSNFFLTDRHLAVKYNPAGWDALAASPLAASSTTAALSTPVMRRVHESDMLEIALNGFQDRRLTVRPTLQIRSVLYWKWL